MSSSGWKRPQGAAKPAQNTLRNTFSSLSFHDIPDSGSENSENQIRRPTLSAARSFPTRSSSTLDGDADDESQSISVSGPSNSDGLTGRDNSGTDTSITQEVANQQQLSRPVNNGNAQGTSSDSPHWDPQALYPPEACVFVANLSQHYDDLTLQASVTKIFARYGTVFVKIKRDKRQMPFGFAQYTKVADAEKALAGIRGIDIHGRPVRTERCNANLVYLIVRRNSRRVQHEEARALFSPFGAIAIVEDLDVATQKRLHLPPAVRVRFEMFDPRRDVIKAIGNNTPFLILNFDFKMAQDASERDPTDLTFMDMHDKDTRSIFIGCIPIHTDEIVIRDIAATAGKVISVNLRQALETATGMASYFAFVEYERPDVPEKAARLLNGMMLNGSALRVERKKPKPLTQARAAPAAPYGTLPPNRPHRRTGSKLAAAFTTPVNEGPSSLRARSHNRAASDYASILAGPTTLDFSMGAWPPKEESSPYEQPAYEQPQPVAHHHPSAYRQAYQPSFLEMQSEQSPYQHTSYRQPTYAGSEYQQMQYQKLQHEEALAKLEGTYTQQESQSMQPEPLNIQRRQFAPETSTGMAPPALPAVAPLPSPAKLRPSVHFAPSPVATPSPMMSTATSSDGGYLSYAHRASTLGPSFSQRLAGGRSGPARRSLSQAFSRPGTEASDRAQTALDQIKDAKTHQTLSMHLQRINEENRADKAAQDAAKKASDEATRKEFKNAVDKVIAAHASSDDDA
ncbi:hypothetical protein ACHAPT_009914 [Fusarium lateritium]